MVAELAQRLSEASVKKWFDPLRDIDWEEPFDLERFYMREEDVSLYGTPIYEGLSQEQKVRLSLHEAASMMAAGIWFENILKHKFIDYLYNRDPHDPNFRYMLHEVGDECRHSIMFGEFIKRSGVSFYPVRWWARLGGQLMKEAVSKTAVFIGILAAEEVTDFFNRRATESPEVHPTVRRIAQIHMIEEARHISYARSHLIEDLPNLPRVRRLGILLAAPVITGVIVSQLVSPEVYSSLDLPKEARRQARQSPHGKKIMLEAGAKFIGLLEEVGVVNPHTRWAWRTTGLVP